MPLLVGEIQPGKRTEVDTRRFVVGARCFLGGGEVLGKYRLTLDMNASQPQPRLSMKRNPTVAALAVGAYSPVQDVLGTSSRTKVGASIVEGVVIDVINVKIVRHISQDKSMQTDRERAGTIRLSTSPSDVSILGENPVVGGNKINVIGIDDRELTSCQWNQCGAVRLEDCPAPGGSARLGAILGDGNMPREHNAAAFTGKLNTHFRVLPECRAGDVRSVARHPFASMNYSGREA